MKKQPCALITGAVRNTGLAAARKFLREGWSVFITSRNGQEAEKKAKELSEEFGQTCIGLSYTPFNAKEEAEYLFRRIAALGYFVQCAVCNAANLGLSQDALEVPLDEWEEVLLTNVTGYFATARTAAREMIRENAAKHGTIVLIGSINYRNAIPDRSAYVASKGAIYAMTKALALDFAPFGIRVNCLMPGPIWTTRYDADPEKAKKKAKPVPIGRVSTTEEIAEGIWFLATDQSGNATGSGLIIDGGLDCSAAIDRE